MELPIELTNRNRKKYLVFDCKKHVSKDGIPYVRMALSEGGTLTDAIMFDPHLNFELKKGIIIEAAAVLQQYNDKPQLKVSEMSFVSAEVPDTFLPRSKFDPSKMAEELQQRVKAHVTTPCLLKLCNMFFTDKEIFNPFQNLPAAKSIHHAYLHGLLEHTLNVVNLVVKITSLYPHINKDLAVTGGLFHDIGKVAELTCEGGFDYTHNGKLLGHLLLGHDIVSDYIYRIDDFPESLRTELLHIIASHHGHLEFGSPQLPKTYEAFVVHYADDLDGKIGALARIILRDEVEEGGWSAYDRALDRNIYRSNL